MYYKLEFIPVIRIFTIIIAYEFWVTDDINADGLASGRSAKQQYIMRIIIKSISVILLAVFR